MAIRFDVGTWSRIARALLLVAAASLAIGLIVDTFAPLISGCTITSVRNPGTGFCKVPGP